MRWLYRLQSRVGLSDPEGIAALVLLVALAVGGVVHHRQATSSPLPPDFYAAADAAFTDATQASEDGAAPPLALFSAPPSADPVPSDSAATDSTAADIAEAEVAVASAPRRRAGKPPPARTNINTASAAELQRLPRIGPALAERIVAYRQTNGLFRHPDQITEVKGIGEKTLEKLRPWIHI